MAIDNLDGGVHLAKSTIYLLYNLMKTEYPPSWNILNMVPRTTQEKDCE